MPLIYNTDFLGSMKVAGYSDYREFLMTDFQFSFCFMQMLKRNLSEKWNFAHFLHLKICLIIGCLM